jgi:tetratricopeptide (TPR) repeat protein
MLAWSWMPLSGRFYLNLELPTRFGFGVTPSFFPHGLPKFLEQIDFQGNVLNSNTLGGFLTYHRYPQNLPLTDGRWEIYGPERIEAVMATTRTPGAWRNVVRSYDLRGILLAHTSPEATALLPDLAHDPNWRLVYVDHAASFWMPGAAPETPAARAPREALSTLPPRFDDAVILAAFYDGIGAHALQVEALERALEFGWRPEMLLEQLGPLQLDLEDYADAERTYRRLIARDPRNAPALNELAFLAYVRGDLDDALSLMRKALVLDADNPQYRQNLDRLRAAFDAAATEESGL